MSYDKAILMIEQKKDERIATLEVRVRELIELLNKHLMVSVNCPECSLRYVSVGHMPDCRLGKALAE